jgi:hypothetical protein
MLPYYDHIVAMQEYQERLQAAEEERLWQALRRQRPSALKQIIASIQAFVAAHRPAPIRTHTAADRV